MLREVAKVGLLGFMIQDDAGARLRNHARDAVRDRGKTEGFISASRTRARA